MFPIISPLFLRLFLHWREAKVYSQIGWGDGQICSLGPPHGTSKTIGEVYGTLLLLSMSLVLPTLNLSLLIDPRVALTIEVYGC